MMKKAAYLFLSLLSLFFVCGCSNDEPDAKDSKAEYYVKYEVFAKTQHYNVDKTINFTIDKGAKTIVLTGTPETTWKGTYGPVKKGFAAELTANVRENYQYDKNFHVRIYVCRRDEPFVIKAEQEGESISLRYGIDY